MHPLFEGERRNNMNKYKLIAAFIIALILMLCLAAGAVISRLLYLLPSPWNHIAIGLFSFSMLTWGVYLWINKLEKEENDSPELTDKLKDE